MQHLSSDYLYSLEHYAKTRNDFRQQVMAHKQDRRIPVGAHATLYFEDRLTIQYQVQEMLRAERIFETDGIQEELDTYNPLISGGQNLKCTAMLEFKDAEVRRQRLAELIGIEHKIWVRVGDLDKVFAIANEDLERSNETKTSAVHFMRFELTDEMIGALGNGAALAFGCDHPGYRHEAAAGTETRRSLRNDLL